MSLVERLIEQYLRLTEHSRTTRIVVYGITAFIVIFGMDMISHNLGGKEFPGEHLLVAISESVVLAVIGDHISQLREERILRRERQMQYLNHHVRNALALLKLVEQQLEAHQAVAVHNASDRICGAVEQVSRDEDVKIDVSAPEKLLRKTELDPE
jgi:hypothetical protein